MKKLINGVFGILLLPAVGAMPLHAMKSKAKKVEAPIERVIKGVSALEQIMDQVQLIVEFEDPTSLAHAQKQLTSLMNNKALNPKIKDVIKDDIEIINRTTDSNRKASQEAYDRLKVVAKQVEAQANVVAAIEEGAELVKNASVEEKQEAINAAQEKIKEAQEEQGWLEYLYTGAKRVITAPVNYVFGEESSKAKTAFYTTVGAAVLVAGAYGVSQSEAAPEKKEHPILPPMANKKNEIKVELPKDDIKEPFEKSAETKRIEQEQLGSIINYSVVEQQMKDRGRRRWLEITKEMGRITKEEEQELEDIVKRMELLKSQVENLKQNGISDDDIKAAFKVQSQAVITAEQEKENLVMANLAETQRKYLKSAEPEDREALYAYEKDIQSKIHIPWEKIYESRNKIREEEGIGKDFELALLVKVERKYISEEKKRSWLRWNVAEMFDTLTPREINTLHDRVIKEIEEGVHFENITAQLTGDEESKREFEKFTQRFAPPLNIQETIESYKNKNIEYGLLRGKDESSNVFAKGKDIARVFNAERMRNCIEHNNFTTIAVPKKWIYKVNGEWRVYAEYIPQGSGKILTLQETQELVELAEQTGFRDWRGNIIIDKRNGKITIIDTEDYSFMLGMYKLGDFPQNCKLQYAYSLYYYYNRMDADAKRWFENRIDYLKNSAEGTIENEPLPQSGKFDDPNFDFAKIKEELEEDTNEIYY